jgi:hypothetical protein
MITYLGLSNEYTVYNPKPEAINIPYKYQIYDLLFGIIKSIY